MTNYIFTEEVKKKNYAIENVQASDSNIKGFTGTSEILQAGNFLEKINEIKI